MVVQVVRYETPHWPQDKRNKPKIMGREVEQTETHGEGGGKGLLFVRAGTISIGDFSQGDFFWGGACAFIKRGNATGLKLGSSNRAVGRELGPKETTEPTGDSQQRECDCGRGSPTH